MVSNAEFLFKDICDPGKDPIQLDWSCRVNVHNRAEPARFCPSSQLDELRHIGGTGMAWQPFTAALSISLPDKLRRRMAPKLQQLGYPCHGKVFAQDVNRLESEPGVNDERRTRRGLLDDRENRLVAGSAKNPIERTIDVFNQFQKRILYRVQREDGPSGFFRTGSELRCFFRKQELR